MKEWLTFAAENAVVVINAISVVVIVIGTIEAFLRGTRAIFRRSVTGHELRSAYLQYTRWLVAGLTSRLLRTSSKLPSRQVGRKSGALVLSP